MCWKIPNVTLIFSRRIIILTQTTLTGTNYSTKMNISTHTTSSNTHTHPVSRYGLMAVLCVCVQMSQRHSRVTFHHVIGKAAVKGRCYHGLSITRSVQDNQFCAVNPRFIAVVTECTGGGAFIVISIHKVRPHPFDPTLLC